MAIMAFRRFGLIQFRSVLALLALTIPAVAQNPDLSITWIGQSCFVLTTSGGPTVVTDPPVASVGYTLPALTADAVTITHNHTDHNNAAAIGGMFTLVDGRPVTDRQEMAAAGTNFVLIPGFHDHQNGALRGPNTMIVWTQAGMKIAHLGDLGQDSLTDAQLADLQNVDILFIAAGGFFTVTPTQAAAYVKQLKPRVAILMHYQTALGGPAQLAGLAVASDPFLPVVYKPSTVTVNQATLPAVGHESAGEVWVMEPLSDTVAVSSASYAPGVPVAPAAIASAFGSFTGSQSVGASEYPLPRKLGDTEVFVDGKAVPLVYVSPGQANFQVPNATVAGQSLLEVHVGGQPVGRGPMTVVRTAPSIYAVFNQDGSLNSPDVPAHPGDILVIYCTGLGAVSPAVNDGNAASAVTLSMTVSPPAALLGGRILRIQFTGLTPGLAGVYQVNAEIPENMMGGSALPLTLGNLLVSNAVPVAVSQ
jgi:uncharacterized protein (TIGR03437 family)